MSNDATLLFGLVGVEVVERYIKDSYKTAMLQA